jgi:anti-sigma B factor antagonist
VTMQAGDFDRRERTDTGALIVLRGEIDGLNATEVRDRIVGARRRASSTVVVDMADVTFMDSQGLRALLEARQLLAEDGAPLRLVRPARCVLLVLSLTGVQELFSIET